MCSQNFIKLRYQDPAGVEMSLSFRTKYFLFLVCHYEESDLNLNGTKRGVGWRVILDLPLIPRPERKAKTKLHG